jgi:uncharacterized protein (DUF362 family)
MSQGQPQLLPEKTMSSPKNNPTPYQAQWQTRREFLGKAALSSAIVGGLGYLSLAPEHWKGSLKYAQGLRGLPAEDSITLKDFRVPKPSKFTPDLVTCSGSGLSNNLKACLDALGGLRHYCGPGDIVLVKPNVAFDRSPILGATSNPFLLDVVIKMLLRDCRVDEVRVADNPIESPPDCFAKSGIGKASLDAGARIYLPDSNAFETLHTPGAALIENWTFFSRPFKHVTKVIGLSPIKDHNLCFASMGLKNWYGLLGGPRNQFHQDIHGIISDLSIMIRPTLTILDGSHVLMKNGPTGGDPSHVKLSDSVVVGLDPVALDTWAFEHLLERGKDFPAYLAKAETKGAGRMDYSGRLKELS